mmetsp:Transcript_15437/g.36189  ORF Transcript_15437/g.36189 Transcript_15437/m.36189 type:complete len:253 (-) Transcript_15437:5459-6217(-)
MAPAAFRSVHLALLKWESPCCLQTTETIETARRHWTGRLPPEIGVSQLQQCSLMRPALTVPRFPLPVAAPGDISMAWLRLQRHHQPPSATWHTTLKFHGGAPVAPRLRGSGWLSAVSLARRVLSLPQPGTSPHMRTHLSESATSAPPSLPNRLLGRRLRHQPAVAASFLGPGEPQVGPLPPHLPPCEPFPKRGSLRRSGRQICMALEIGHFAPGSQRTSPVLPVYQATPPDAIHLEARSTHEQARAAAPPVP